MAHLETKISQLQVRKQGPWGAISLTTTNVDLDHLTVSDAAFLNRLFGLMGLEFHVDGTVPDARAEEGR